MKPVAVLTCVLCTLACDADEGGIPPGQRILTARVQLVRTPGDPHEGRALQAVALHAAPECAHGVGVGRVTDDLETCAIFGEPFDPGMQGGGVPAGLMRLVIPCDLTVNVILQTLGSSGGQTLGNPLALLVFPGGPQGATSLLAREPACRDTPKLATVVVDLGPLNVTLSPDEALPALVVGGQAGGRDPLGIIDTDDDLVPNASDDDDDGDEIPDSMDEDADGDGLADVAQVFAPDWFKGDGRPSFRPAP